MKYTSLLNKYNIKSSEVTFTNLDFSMSEAEDLINNRADVVDLYRTDQIYDFNKQGLEFSVIYPELFGIASYGDVLVTTDDMISKQPDTVEAFVHATLQGWEYVINHIDETVSIVDKYDDAAYEEEGREKFILEKSAELIRTSGNRPLGTMDYNSWNIAAKKMSATKLINTDFDITKAYTTRFIQQ